MHSAPAVRYPVPRSAHAGRACAALCVLSILPLALWWRPGMSVAALGAVAAAWLLAVAVGAWQWRGMHAGWLRWDGQAWFWLPDAAAAHEEHAVRIALRLDLQFAVLVRMDRVPGWVRWRYLARSAAPGRWNDLRRALFQRRADVPHVPVAHQP